MAEDLSNEMSEDSSNEVFTLVDEEGKENEFELIGRCEMDGVTYLALIPMDENENGEYVILKISKDENGDDVLVTIDDDDEFDKVVDIFEDELFDEVDYDETSEN